MSSMDITEFLAKCVADDERKALAARQGHGFSDGVSGTPWHAVGSLLLATQPDGTTERIAEVVYYGYDDVLIHAEQHDPARVLREVAAKRTVISATLDYMEKIDGEWGCCHSAESIAAGRCEDLLPENEPIFRALASVYADRPGYKEEWKP